MTFRKSGSEKEAVGIYLRNLRKKLKLPQGVVARRAKLDQSQLSRIERGVHSPNLSSLMGLVGVLAGSPDEEKAIMHEIIYRYPSARATDQELEGITFIEAKDKALRQLERGDYFEARKQINAMERLAESSEEIGRAKIYLASCAKDLGHYDWSLQLFMQASTLLDSRDKTSKNWDMYLLNLGDLYCYLNQPMLAEILIRELMQRNPSDSDFYHCWGVFEQGRICLLRDEFEDAVDRFREAVKKMKKVEGKPANYVGWFECWLAMSLIRSDRTRDEGISILYRLKDEWGPDDSPEDAENYVLSALLLARATGKRSWLNKAEHIAKKKGYRNIMREIENIKENGKREEGLPSGMSRVAYLIAFLIFWLVTLSPIASWAKSGLEGWSRILG